MSARGQRTEGVECVETRRATLSWCLILLNQTAINVLLLAGITKISNFIVTLK